MMQDDCAFLAARCDISQSEKGLVPPPPGMILADWHRLNDDDV